MRKVKRIQWVDSTSNNDWQGMGEMDKTPHVITSIGFLVSETTKYMTLSHSVTNDGKQHAGFISIPKCSIIKTKKR